MRDELTITVHDTFFSFLHYLIFNYMIKSLNVYKPVNK